MGLTRVWDLPRRSWTEAMDAALRRCRAEGMTAAQSAQAIAEACGVVVSRHAVLGRWARLGIQPGRPKPAAPSRAGRPVARRPAPAASPPAPASGRPPKISARGSGGLAQGLDFRRPRQPAPEPVCVVAVPVPEPVGVTLAGLEARACRWPLWSHAERAGPDALYCGAARAPGQSYCAGHRAMAWRRVA